MRRLALALAIGALLIGIGFATAGESRARGPGGDTVELGACPEKVRPQKLRCATLRVPLERADPALGSIRVRFAVRERSHGTRPLAGTIFAVEGGPGYDSIASARNVTPPATGCASSCFAMAEALARGPRPSPPIGMT
jgi:hypothetical protein